MVMGVTFTRFCASAFSSSCLLDSSLVGKSCTRMYKGSKWHTRSLHSWIVHPMFLQFSPPNFPSQRHNILVAETNLKPWPLKSMGAESTHHQPSSTIDHQTSAVFRSAPAWWAALKHPPAHWSPLPTPGFPYLGFPCRRNQVATRWQPKNAYVYNIENYRIR